MENKRSLMSQTIGGKNKIIEGIRRAMKPKKDVLSEVFLRVLYRVRIRAKTTF